MCSVVRFVYRHGKIQLNIETLNVFNTSFKGSVSPFDVRKLLEANFRGKKPSGKTNVILTTETRKDLIKIEHFFVSREH